MRWSLKDFGQWHLWFAWYPVAVGETGVWLTRIERRAKLWHPEVGYYWEYRLMETGTEVTTK